MREPEDPIIQLHASGRHQVIISVQRTKKRHKPFGDTDLVRPQIAPTPASFVPTVQIAPDSPVPGDLILYRKRCGDAVLGTTLPRCPQCGHFGKEFGRQDPAFGLECSESAAGSYAGHL